MASAPTVWRTIASEAAAESILWEQALRPEPAWAAAPLFSAFAEERFALAVESIYEGYLLHYGRPRLFQPGDAGTAVLLGDYLYAHGLVRLSALGDVGPVADLAELISLCTQLRAAGSEPPSVDGVAWAATVSQLGARGPRLERGRAALRLEGDPGPLERLAAEAVGRDRLVQALAAHGALVE